MRSGWGVVLFLAGVFGLVVPLAAQDPTRVVSPRPQSWVRDDAGMLSAEDIGSIDARIDLARKDHAIEFAVLTVPDIGTQDPRRFATAVFNAWGIGDPQRHDGTLIFIARKQRAAEIVLGQGIDGEANIAASRRVMDQALIPHLRDGDVAGGVLASVEALLRDIHGIAPPQVEAPAPALERDAAAIRVPRGTPEPIMPLRSSEGPMPDDDASLRPTTLFGGGALALLGAFALRWWWRIRGRQCPRCNAAMQRLSETADDAHLQASQQLEERLGSVNYDVWACSACSFVDTRRYGAWFSRHARCSACNTVALSRSQSTVVHATYDHGGRVRVDEDCQHCGHHRHYEANTPAKTRPSNRGSGSGGGGRSSFGRGGSGFSGGRSRGGGASGRW